MTLLAKLILTYPVAPLGFGAPMKSTLQVQIAPNDCEVCGVKIAVTRQALDSMGPGMMVEISECPCGTETRLERGE